MPDSRQLVDRVVRENDAGIRVAFLRRVYLLLALSIAVTWVISHVFAGTRMAEAVQESRQAFVLIFAALMVSRVLSMRVQRHSVQLTGFMSTAVLMGVVFSCFRSIEEPILDVAMLASLLPVVVVVISSFFASSGTMRMAQTVGIASAVVSLIGVVLGLICSLISGSVSFPIMGLTTLGLIVYMVVSLMRQGYLIRRASLDDAITMAATIQNDYLQTVQNILESYIGSQTNAGRRIRRKRSNSQENHDERQ